MKTPDREFTDKIQRLLSRWGEKAVMGIVIVAAVFGLAHFASQTTRPHPGLETDSRPGAGIVVRSEVLRLCLPGTLIELAKRRSRSPVVQVHEELQRFLELQNQQDLWYLLTTRGHQVNGDFADITVIRRPYQEPEHFPELLAVLATAAGNPPRYPTADFSTASVHIMPEESWKRGPRAVLAELQSLPSPIVGEKRAP